MGFSFLQGRYWEGFYKGVVGGRSWIEVLFARDYVYG
jgi:hypothetical protein